VNGTDYETFSYIILFSFILLLS